MRNINTKILISLILLSSCNHNDSQITKNDIIPSNKRGNSIVSSTKKTEVENSVKQANPDSSSLNYLKYLFNQKIKIPTNLCVKYFKEDSFYVNNYRDGCFPDTILIDNNNFTAFVYTIYCAAGGTCEEGKLATINRNGNLISKINSQGNFGDMQFSSSYYFEFNKPSEIIVHFEKEEYDDEYNLKSDTSYTINYHITLEGLITRLK